MDSDRHATLRGSRPVASREEPGPPVPGHPPEGSVAGVAQISCSCGDGLIRPPSGQVGQPEVHYQGPGRQHGVGAPP